jgi:hypothetical protein
MLLVELVQSGASGVDGVWQEEELRTESNPSPLLKFVDPCPTCVPATNQRRAIRLRQRRQEILERVSQQWQNSQSCPCLSSSSSSSSSLNGGNDFKGIAKNQCHYKAKRKKKNMPVSTASSSRKTLGSIVLESPPHGNIHKWHAREGKKKVLVISQSGDRNQQQEYDHNEQEYRDRISAAVELPSLAPFDSLNASKSPSLCTTSISSKASEESTLVQNGSSFATVNAPNMKRSFSAVKMDSFTDLLPLKLGTSRRSPEMLLLELTISKCIMDRERLLRSLRQLAREAQWQYERWQETKGRAQVHTSASLERVEHVLLLKYEQLQVLITQIRKVTVNIVTHDLEWRQSLRRRGPLGEFSQPSSGFPWKGSSYLIKMSRDLKCLATFAVLKQWLGFSIEDNPLILPPMQLQKQGKQHKLFASAGTVPEPIWGAGRRHCREVTPLVPTSLPQLEHQKAQVAADILRREESTFLSLSQSKGANSYHSRRAKDQITSSSVLSSTSHLRSPELQLQLLLRPASEAAKKSPSVSALSLGLARKICRNTFLQGKEVPSHKRQQRIDAAHSIQSWFKKETIRHKKNAATAIQVAALVFIQARRARKRLRRLRELRQRRELHARSRAAAAIQSFFRYIVHAQHLQRTYLKQAVQRKHAHEMKLHRAAIKLQHVYRIYRARAVARHLRIERAHKSATSIQAVFRGRRERQRLQLWDAEQPEGSLPAVVRHVPWTSHQQATALAKAMSALATAQASLAADAASLASSSRRYSYLGCGSSEVSECTGWTVDAMSASSISSSSAKSRNLGRSKETQRRRIQQQKHAKMRTELHPLLPFERAAHRTARMEF